MRLDGRVALVTGAGRGLGRAHALALADLGAAVVVNDLGTDLDGHGASNEPADTVVAEIRARSGRAASDHTDVGSMAGGRAVVDATVAEFGRVDIVVNNAGLPAGDLDALLDIHLKGALGTMDAAFPVMQANGYGRIVNTVSEVALDARFAGPLGYGVAKAALWSATLSAAVEYAPHGITVNAISPGARTRMNAEVLDASRLPSQAPAPAGTVGKAAVPARGFRDGASDELDLAPEHVAAVVAYLASPAAGDITGRVIHAAGGALREYETRRSADTELIRRLRAVLE